MSNQARLKTYLIKIKRVDYEHFVKKSQEGHALRKKLSAEFIHIVSKELQFSHGINCWLGKGSNNLNSSASKSWSGIYRCCLTQCQAVFKCSLFRHQQASNDGLIELEIEICNLSEKQHAKIVKKKRLAGEKRKQALLEVRATSIKRVVNKNVLANLLTGADGSVFSSFLKN
jgi:hypothetical protein